MASRLFIIWLTLLPLIIWTTGYEGPKVAYFLFGSLAVLIFWIKRLLGDINNIKFSKSDWFFLSWLVVLSISSFFGVHPLESFVGGSYRHQGVLFFLALWVIAKTVGILSGGNKKLLTKGIGIAVFAEALIIILQTIGGQLYLGRPLGTIGEQNAVAGFLAIGSFFISPQNFSFLGVVMVAVILTLSKSGFFSFIVVNFYYVFARISRKLTFILIAA